ncbi:MAG: 2OG-Fe(II) oxygenase [Allosphingosinicella sp.]
MGSEDTIGRVDRLLAERRFPDAARLLFAAAEAGESQAIAELAHWRIVGNVIRRDLAEARRLLERAASKGETEAALLHSSFLASGTGGAADWAGALAELRALAPDVPAAAAQLRLLDAMDLDDKGFPRAAMGRRELSAEPEAVAADAFLSEAECAYLRQAAEPALQPSVVVDPATGRMVPHPIRTSDGTMFGVHGEDLVVGAINRRIAALSDTRPEQGEPLQILRYRPGAQYREHMDALPAEPNQRILTVLVYLSSDYEGGETHFPRIGLTFRGEVGDALLFRNADAEGRPDPLALHAGLPVTRGVKYLASRWIRAAPFHYPPPRPLLDL